MFLCFFHSIDFNFFIVNVGPKQLGYASKSFKIGKGPHVKARD